MRKRRFCALCGKKRSNTVAHGGDRGICRTCLGKIDKMILREETAVGYEGPHIYAGGVACVRLRRGGSAKK